jgi:hypothetical protein
MQTIKLTKLNLLAIVLGVEQNPELTLFREASQLREAIVLVSVCLY